MSERGPQEAGPIGRGSEEETVPKRLKLKQQSLILKQLLGPAQDEDGPPRIRERVGDLWRHRGQSRSTEAALGMIEWLASRKRAD